MVVDNLYVRRTGSTLSPVEAHPPLIINPDAELPLPVSLQRLKTVAGQDGEISQSNSSLQAVELQTCCPFDA